LAEELKLALIELASQAGQPILRTHEKLQNQI
jgi:hypothetical protein